MSKLIGTNPDQVPVNGMLGHLAFQDLVNANQIQDGSGSGLDADLLDGQDSSFYRNASNINSGIISDARLDYIMGPRKVKGLHGTHYGFGASNSILLDLMEGNYFSATIVSNANISVSNVPPGALYDGVAVTFTLELTNAGAYTITFVNMNIKTSGGGAIILTASGRDRLFFTTRDGGSTWDLAIMRDIK